ncbi:hypothetical protein [Ornithinimicrobium kibberense]
MFLPWRGDPASPAALQCTGGRSPTTTARRTNLLIRRDERRPPRG